jgi:hypothetical protein
MCVPDLDRITRAPSVEIRKLKDRAVCALPARAGSGTIEGDDRLLDRPARA